MQGVSPKRLAFSRRILARIREFDEMSLAEVEETARGMGIEVEYEVLGNGLYLIKDDSGESGYFRPSLLSAYFHCARKVWLARRYGDVKTREGLKALLRGRIVHVLWQEEHPEFDVEVELLDEDEGVHGIADALLVGDGSAVLVELKTSHRVTLGHKLQTMLYGKLVRRLYGAGRVGAFVVYRYGVEEVGYDERMLSRYMKRVRAVLDLDAPPPALPRELNSRCENCSHRFLCARYPRGSWDDWLVRISDYPISEEKCGDCPHLRFCRAFKAKTGEYPCTSKQTLLV